MNPASDSIERKILLKATRSHVWRVLANAEAFGQWFGVALEGKRFIAGEWTQGQITYPGYEHVLWNVLVERVEPEQVFSFRWHPYAVDPEVDYSQEPTTLVKFELEDMDERHVAQGLRVRFRSHSPGAPAKRRSAWTAVVGKSR